MERLTSWYTLFALVCIMCEWLFCSAQNYKQKARELTAMCPGNCERPSFMMQHTVELLCVCVRGHMQTSLQFMGGQEREKKIEPGTAAGVGLEVISGPCCYFCTLCEVLTLKHLLLLAVFQVNILLNQTPFIKTQLLGGRAAHFHS